LEAIRAPTRGKARKDTKLNISLMVPTVSQLPGDCADGERTYNAPLAKKIVRERPASTHASVEAARRAFFPLAA